MANKVWLFPLKIHEFVSFRQDQCRLHAVCFCCGRILMVLQLWTCNVSCCHYRGSSNLMISFSSHFFSLQTHKLTKARWGEACHLMRKPRDGEYCLRRNLAGEEMCFFFSFHIVVCVCVCVLSVFSYTSIVIGAWSMKSNEPWPMGKKKQLLSTIKVSILDIRTGTCNWWIFEPDTHAGCAFKLGSHAWWSCDHIEIFRQKSIGVMLRH